MGLLREVPPHAGLLFVAGVSALHVRQPSKAVALLRQAVALNPARADYLAQLARALAMSFSLEEAMRVAEQSLRAGPTDATTFETLGAVLALANDHARAATLFERAVALEPGHPPYRFGLATSLLFTGDLQGAERELEACIALAPHYWKAHLALSQLRRQTASRNHIARLQGLLEQARGDEPGLFLHLALAKELEDLGDYPRAFEALVRGKAAGGRGRDYDAANDRALFEALTANVPAQAATTGGLDSSAPVFVFGMPRSGTTLVDRILSSHPDVHSAGELQDFGVALKRASGSRTPALLDIDTVTRASNLDWRALGAAYLQSVATRRGSRQRFVDKLPHNFLYVGYIARALPEARMICVRRDPVDTCLSNFRQLFALDTDRYDYSFDLLDTGCYYLLFDRLMAHWRRVLPGRVLEVTYEDLVEAQEATTRDLIAFCGLPWHDACLRFHDNPAPVATASAAQVRAPLYRDAMQRWRHYAPQLAGLLRLLEEGGVLPPGEYA